jgi:bifunctional NMN adenylyltransferase/nudix hydrolase
MTKEDKGIVLGRFQPLHEGHEHLIKSALDKFNKVLVIIGSANQVRSPKNPYTYQERVAMISKRFYDNVESEALIFAPLNDYKYDEEKWVSDFIDTKRHFGMRDATLCVHFKQDNAYAKKICSKVYEVESHINLDATTIRQKLFECRSLPEEVMEDMMFYKKEKELFANYPFQETLQFNCADCVVLAHSCILLIKRKNAPGKGRWALPGGYKNSSESFQSTAIRELREETGLRGYVNLPEYIKDSKLYDAPNRGFGIPRVTRAFLFDLPADYPPVLLAGDDALEAKWFPIEKIASNLPLYDDHKDIIFDMLNRRTSVRELPAYKCVY